MDDVTLNEVSIDRHGNDDDLSKYTPEQLELVLAEKRSRRHAAMAMLFVFIGLFIAVIVGIPLIAALYRWGFGV